MLKPAKVIDIELSRPLRPVDNLDDYRSVQALVRLHGTPLGYAVVPVRNGVCRPGDLLNAILEKCSPSIIRHLLCEAVAAGLSPEAFDLNCLFRNGFQEKRAAPAGSSDRQPLFTVAVCTRDNTSLLDSCLESLNCIDYPNLDILVIDNAPGSDSTERLVRSKYRNMRYICEHRPGLDWARNRAIQEAKGEVIAYTDDDVVVDRSWISALADLFSENPEVKAVTGLVVPYELETGAQELFEEYGGFGRGFERKWVRADPGVRSATLYGGSGKFGTGANMAFRRSLFDAIGCFDPALDVGTVTNGGGDLDIFFRVLKEGYTLVYEPCAIVRHRHRRDYGGLHKQLTNWGTGFFSCLMRNAIAYPDERPAFIRLGLRRFRKKIRSVLASFLRANRLHKYHLAELRGSCSGLFRYFQARSAAEKIRDAGPALSVMTALRKASIRPDYKHRMHTAVRNIEISCPLSPLTDVSDYKSVQVIVTWKGKPLGALQLETLGQPIGPARLCEAIVDCLGLRLLDTDQTRSINALTVEEFSTLRQCLLQKNGSDGTEARNPGEAIPSKLHALHDEAV
jgi:O-antigen biosynthesis protein